MSDPQDRCRVILVANAAKHDASEVASALEGGDIASIVLDQGGVPDHIFEEFCRKLTPPAQEKDVAVLVVEDTQLCGRLEMDGILFPPDKKQISDAIARFSPQKIVGCFGVKNRHNALELGELKPDFVMFGKPSGDIKPQAHPKNLDLGKWWSELVEIPCIIAGGNAIETVVEVSQIGADFVALGDAVFTANGAAKAMVEKANVLLDQDAPRFSEMAE